MAGVTDLAYRTLCREYGAGLCVSEMVTSRGLVERDEKSFRYLSYAPDEPLRSVQLYGVDPAVVEGAVRLVVDEGRADHVDLNFGCPVPKVTRHGGGAALPWKRRLFRDVVRGAVRGAQGRVPVTVKMRVGVDPEHVTYLDAGRTAEDEGAAWVALHGRTAIQGYSGEADWSAITRLVDALDVPVLGNGDVWEAADAVRMQRETGCAGVVVGRGCLGRPWLFRALAAVLEGREAPRDPGLAEVARVLRRHAELLVDLRGEGDGLRHLRKHMAWYLKGFVVGGTVRSRLGLVSSLAELDDLLAELDGDQPFPASEQGRPRGRTSPSARVVLPEGWLDDRDSGVAPALAELNVSGG
ncbi:MAG: tRNA dihydrouridine synthase DusB [Actinomycetota bacterium]|nr:tRNA dihydrouridine synthase DusB [Actinomycetota bacterium]